MGHKLQLKDIILNNTDNIVESILKLIEYKIMHEGLEEDIAIKETLDYLYIIVSLHDIDANKESKTDLLELIRIKYEDYKITTKIISK